MSLLLLHARLNRLGMRQNSTAVFAVPSKQAEREKVKTIPFLQTHTIS